ncbi:hypothetical protein FOXB_16168 [Fusarium oxysporum f. sp. conglutinans Fo5176]|uniref:Uncharacterized protein n=1 Tax=Fusarium oxysporum (strain Fo5176) TaxID=660025 RepID=F9GBY5_FUSOF|nr:hypothetical protein FOXB_16168 [Fusarium oxysporum f. sp. conglutinans Fo5176]
MAFLDTLSEALPELGQMCTDSNVLSNEIYESCRQFKGRHPDRNLIDFLVYMEYQALKNETDEQMKDQMIKYIQDPTIQLPVDMKKKHDASMQKIRDLRVNAASQFYTPPELKFLTEHAPQHLPIIGALGKDLLADFTIDFCFEFREQHPKGDIFELLFYAERMMTVYKKNAKPKIQEFIQQEKLPRIEDMDFGTDTHLIKLRRQEALSILEGLRKPQPDPTKQPDAMDRAMSYDAAARRSFRDPFVGTAEDPSADRCVIADPETQQPVEADIVGRHPHRRKWLVCAIPSLNPRYSKLERFPTIDGSSSEYRNVLENYSLRGSNRTIPVGDMQDLKNCSMKDFELNGVILLPWGDDTRISGFGVSHWKQNEFKIFAKTPFAEMWIVDSYRKRQSRVGNRAKKLLLYYTLLSYASIEANITQPRLKWLYRRFLTNL